MAGPRRGRLGDAVDPMTRTLKVRVVLANPGLRLKPDMFATVRLLRSSSQGILIPATAVSAKARRPMYSSATGDNRFERREVMLGRTVDDNMEVTSGLRLAPSSFPRARCCCEPRRRTKMPCEI